MWSHLKNIIEIIVDDMGINKKYEKFWKVLEVIIGKTKSKIGSGIISTINMSYLHIHIKAELIYMQGIKYTLGSAAERMKKC